MMYFYLLFIKKIIVLAIGRPVMGTLPVAALKRTCSLYFDCYMKTSFIKLLLGYSANYCLTINIFSVYTVSVIESRGSEINNTLSKYYFTGEAVNELAKRSTILATIFAGKSAMFQFEKLSS